jgi:hypothetical protein
MGLEEEFDVAERITQRRGDKDGLETAATGFISRKNF